MEHFSLIAALLTRLTRKGIKFYIGWKVWTTFPITEQSSYHHSSSHSPDYWSHICYVQWCVRTRSQMYFLQGGRVIVYASRQSMKHETIYPTHKLELAAVDFTLMIWRHYLFGETCQLSFDKKKFGVFSLKENWIWDKQMVRID